MRMTLPVDDLAGHPPREGFDQFQLVFGSRGSALALWQTHWVIDRACAAWPDLQTTIVEINTRGDATQHLDTPLAQLGDKAMFVEELERALDAGNRSSRGTATPAPLAIDAAVHSLKDLPGQLDARFTLAAITERADPRDALVSRRGLGLWDLPHGARVATSSLRRKAQLLHVRPDLDIVNIRGNVDTRLRKTLAEDGPDATILAYAGLARLGLERYVTELLSPETLVPAVGQGALAVETRANDERTARLLAITDHDATRQCVTAERAVLATLGGGCFVPLGAHATATEDSTRIRLVAVIATPDGSRLIRAERVGLASMAANLGKEVAEDMLAQGAEAILSQINVR